jgi:hypothetical protein
MKRFRARWLPLPVAVCLALVNVGLTHAAVERQRTYTRPCDDSVYGDLGKGWRADSVTVGPLALVGARAYRDDPPKRFRKRRNGYRSQKILAVVENGRNVSLKVPRRQRKHIALSYDPSHFDEQDMRIREADYLVVFDACRNRAENPFGKKRAQFNGGFVVAGARCARLNVLRRGRRIGRAVVSFGKGRCRN